MVRDARKGAGWSGRGREVATGDMTDADALAAVFAEVASVFVLIPPIFDPAPEILEVRADIAALMKAVGRARPPRLVCLSTVGAQSREPNFLSRRGDLREVGLALHLHLLAPVHSAGL